MRELVRDLEALKLKNVRTYIQSGNVIFDSAHRNASSLSNEISRTIERRHGFGPRVLIISCNELQNAIDANPFPDAISEPKSLHFFFLEKPPLTPNMKALDLAKTSTENYLLTDRVFYLHTPDGFAGSKLASTAERHLGILATARNYRTVARIAEIAADI